MSIKRRKYTHKRDDISLSYRIESVPGGTVSKKLFFDRCILFITHGDGLPKGWRIILRWRNAESQDWREDEFQSAINDSREGFRILVRRRMERDRAAQVKKVPRKNRKTEKKYSKKRRRKVRHSVRTSRKARPRTKSGRASAKMRRGRKGVNSRKRRTSGRVKK